jgi:uncharacterized protein YndB with AHSA1/START domain
MPDILHRLIIPAAPQTVFDLIATPNGIKQWWTQDARGGGEVGEILELGFNGRKAIVRFQVAEVVLDQRLVWVCTEQAGGMDEWPGTSLIWNLAAWRNSETDLRFAHANWRTVAAEYPSCNTLWGQLLLRLKATALGRGAGAMFY